MEEEWKETVVILLPKVKQPDSPSKFRPISLCQTVYKIIAKVLVNRLKGLLPKILAEEQAAFVPGRAISDHCLLAQEMTNKFRVSTSTKGFVALKIDMEQAYDKMSWRTLELVLNRMGFPEKFPNWIMSCIKHPRFTLLINGQLTEGITASCRFRQGCPLSPYLFLFCARSCCLLHSTRIIKGPGCQFVLGDLRSPIFYMLTTL
ncbi:integrator complex subunit 11 [Dendrobium catenatum]|uniref:Integrator complex subunit 11 n=1 Tax=Dendrobium catenatum TaxID=906689 RepID=A0A2I0VGZ1_9ASPA|nr:integrator complex subunit 11 [Dendrobium catenatum]